MVAAVAVVAEVLSEFLCPRDLTAALSACPTGTVTSLEAGSSPARHAGGLACQYLAAVQSAQQTAFSYNGKGGREIFTGHEHSNGKGMEIFTGHSHSNGKGREIFTGHEHSNAKGMEIFTGHSQSNRKGREIFTGHEHSNGKGR